MSDNLDIQFKKRILPNFISNIIYFSISLLVGIFLAPYFIDTLGYSAYGLIPLATSLTTYVTWITDAISLPISRYLTIDLQQAKIKNAQITYNTAIFGTMAIILVFIPFAILLASISPSLFDIGNCNPEDVSLLFLLIFLSVLIRVWSNNFMIVLFAFNRLDQRNLINSTNLLIQIVLIVVLFTLLGPSLEYVGYAYLTSAIIALAISIYLSKKTASSPDGTPKEVKNII